MAALADVRSNVIGGPVSLEAKATCSFLLPLPFLSVVGVRVAVATDVADATGLVTPGRAAIGRARMVGVLPGIAGAVDVAPTGAMRGGIGAIAVGGTGVSVRVRAVTGGGDCVVDSAVEATLSEVAVAATGRVAEGLLVMVGTLDEMMVGTLDEMMVGTLDEMMVGRDEVSVFVATGVAVAVVVAGGDIATLVAVGADVVVLAGTGRLGGVLVPSMTVVGVFVIVGALGAVLVALGVRDGDLVAVGDVVCVAGLGCAVDVAVADGVLDVAVEAAVGVLLGAIAEAAGDAMGVPAAIVSR